MITDTITPVLTSLQVSKLFSIPLHYVNSMGFYAIDPSFTRVDGDTLLWLANGIIALAAATDPDNEAGLWEVVADLEDNFF